MGGPEVTELLEAIEAGQTVPSPCYTDPAVFSTRNDPHDDVEMAKA
jgi:hypothetical protein